MANRLTDRQKKKIVADYVGCENISRVADMNKVSRATVKRVIVAQPDVAEMATKKKNENTLDMLDYMDSKVGDAQAFIDACFAEMLIPGRLKTARLSEITTAMGTTIDKFTSRGQLNESALAKLDKIIEGLDDEAES